MCGIAGVISSAALSFSSSKFKTMLDRIAHRGPDSSGIWERDGVFLGHRRLAIVDLTVAGHQPMLSQNGRFVLTYNGEIYNHHDIRKELDAEAQIKWKGHSDTESLIEAISRWGVANTLDRLNGMFAFAVWDLLEKKLTLARDPFGEKPLCYTICRGSFVFASELSAIRVMPEFNAGPDGAAVSRFLQSGNLAAPSTILKGVRKLPPGCYLEWKPGRDAQLKTYWSLSDVAQRGRKNLITNERDALDELDALFHDAVKLRMMSDVPLGALLSGGIDSSLIVALMQKSQTNAVRTFTIGFNEKDVSEAPYAAAVAENLGTKHEVLFLTEAEALDAIPQMGSIYDEPFADASQVPTYLVSKLARQNVTVTLTGDGCDELFSGYARHVLAQKAWNSINRIPCRKWLSSRVSKIPQPLLKRVANVLGPMIPAGVNPESLGRKLKYSGHLLSADTVDDIYQSYMTNFADPTELMLEAVRPYEKWNPGKPPFENSYDDFVWQDCVDYLPSDILTKVDRASMAVSLEARIPALDRRLAEFAWRLPQNMRWRDGRGKWALREVLYRHVPKKLVDRPKLGFAVPLDRWLRGPLKNWAHDMLSPQRIRHHGVLDANAVALKLNDFQSDGVTTGSQIWTLLMLQSWLDAGVL